MISEQAQKAIGTKLIVNKPQKSETEINTLISLGRLADDLLKDESFNYFIVNRKLEVMSLLESLDYTEEQDHQRIALGREMVALRNLVSSISSASNLGQSLRNRKTVVKE